MNDQKMMNRAITAVRMLSIDAIEKAKSGHPGLPLGAAPMALELWLNHMKHNPANPTWINRDRFVLSAGHGSMLLYSLLYLFGYGLEKTDLEAFRQWGSKTPGHPEYGDTVGVETTTGPLGQGFAMGCGMAAAEQHMAAQLNTETHKLIDHHVFVLAGDGDLMEGVSSEAASLAGTMKLGNLIVLYDDNGITIEGSTDLAFTEDVAKRFEAYGWHVLRVPDGNDCDAIGRAIEEAKARDDRPSLIAVKTSIGYGSPKADTAAVHGAPLGAKALAETKAFYEWDAEPFMIPDDVKTWFEAQRQRLGTYEEEWKREAKAWREENPKKAEQVRAFLRGEYPSVDLETLIESVPEDEATRASSGKVLNELFRCGIPLFGGSADLAPSNKSDIKEQPAFSPMCREGVNIHFGVREFAMACFCNGLALYGGVKPYCATFLVFSDYMKSAIRLSALMGAAVTYVFTHDSIGVGEDGPTHQPVDQLAMLRSIPDLIVLRPAGRLETAAAWKVAVESSKPTALILTRQKVSSACTDAEKARRGAYIAKDAKDPHVMLMASGSELAVALTASDILTERGIRSRVVSMMSMEVFEAQDEEYKKTVLPPTIRTRVAVEAASSMPWYRYVGLDGAIVSMDRFGASAPADILFKAFGFTPEHVADTCEHIVERVEACKNS